MYQIVGGHAHIAPLSVFYHSVNMIVHDNYIAMAVGFWDDVGIVPYFSQQNKSLRIFKTFADDRNLTRSSIPIWVLIPPRVHKMFHTSVI